MRRLMMVFMLVSVTSALAIMPLEVSYQGQLTRPDGTPLDTTVAMTFRLYDELGNPGEFWSETHPAVVVQDGLFNVRLGSITPLDYNSIADITTVDGGALSIQVGSDAIMTPQIPLSSVFYSRFTGTVDGAQGGTIESDVIVNGKANIGSGNSNSGAQAFVAGQDNSANGDYATAGGGRQNHADTAYAATNGGFGNIAGGYGATVGGGQYNFARGTFSTIGGGGSTALVDSNSARGAYSTISGGRQNRADTTYATIAGGFGNATRGYGSTVGGGQYNFARGRFSTIAGGGATILSDSNSIMCDYGTVGGGRRHFIDNVGDATIAGGNNNRINSLGGGSFIGGGTSNVTDASNTVIGGGRNNRTRGDFSVVGGGGSSSLSDSNTVVGDWGVIGGGRGNYIDNVTDATIGGGSHNVIGTGGGGSFVGSGSRNEIYTNYAVIAGGRNNRARGSYAVVGGGGGPTAATDSNSASGDWAAVPGGNNNWAEGDYSFAAGRHAHAAFNGSFVWGDASNSAIQDSATNQFRVRASGGTWFWSTSSQVTGVKLPTAGGAWVSACDSTKKTNIQPVDTKTVLDKVATLPIKQWNYKEADPNVKHIGPMAQDFWNAFHFGEDSLGISTIDPDGIALAAIQELAKRLERLETENTQLRAQVQSLAAANQNTMKEKDK